MFKQYQGTSEYLKAIQARKERVKALKIAKEQSKGIRYTTKGDFCHLAGKGLSYARSWASVPVNG